MKVVKILLAAGAALDQSGELDEEEEVEYFNYHDDNEPDEVEDRELNSLTPRQIAYDQEHQECMKAIEVRDSVRVELLGMRD